MSNNEVIHGDIHSAGRVRRLGESNTGDAGNAARCKQIDWVTPPEEEHFLNEWVKSAPEAFVREIWES